MGSLKDGCMQGHGEEVLLGMDREASEDLWTERSEGGQVGALCKTVGLVGDKGGCRRITRTLNVTVQSLDLIQ